MEKKWEGARDSKTSKACNDNMAAGWIPIAQAFPSGAMQPLNHPGCRHTALYRRMKTPKVEVKPKEVEEVVVNQRTAKEARELIKQRAEELESAEARIIPESYEVNRRIRAREFSSEAEKAELMNRSAQLTEELQIIFNTKNDQLRRFVQVDDPNRITYGFLGDISPANQQAVQEAMQSFNNMVSRSVADNYMFKVAQGGNRAYFDPKNQTVNIPAFGRPPSVIVHEMGHWLETQNPAVQQKVFAFYNKRTEGFPLQQMLGYSPQELTRVDHFIEQYMGKQYSDKDGNLEATEILSMGMELFHEDPLRLATEDPEYFDFIFDLLRGR
jgi:hypothetical protein